MFILKQWHDQFVKRSAIKKKNASVFIQINAFFSDTIFKKTKMFINIDIYDKTVPMMTTFDMFNIL